MSKFLIAGTDDKKTDVLRLESGNRAKNIQPPKNIQPISNINLNVDIEKIKYSLNNPKTKTNLEEYLIVKNNPNQPNQDPNACSIM